MDDRHVIEITAWLMQSGLKGMPEADLLAGFCERCRANGLPIERSVAVMDALHPVYERRAFRWDSREPVERVSEYGFSGPGVTADNWLRSAFHHLETTGSGEIRRRLTKEDPADFYLLEDLKAAGFTDYIAMAHRFGDRGTIGDIDCFFSHFVTRSREGFADSDIAVLRDLLPCLALAVKCVAISGVAGTIARVYLGQDAANQVLHGKIPAVKATAFRQPSGFRTSPISRTSRTRSIRKKSFRCSTITPAL